jgi:hypothetical protein
VEVVGGAANEVGSIIDTNHSIKRANRSDIPSKLNRQGDHGIAAFLPLFGVFLHSASSPLSGQNISLHDNYLRQWFGICRNHDRNVDVVKGHNKTERGVNKVVPVIRAQRGVSYPGVALRFTPG